MAMDPSFARVHSYLGWAYQQMERYEDSVQELERAKELFGGGPARLAELAQAYAVAGRREEALTILAELDSWPDGEYVEGHLIAKIYLALGEEERAIDWLETSFEQGSIHRVLFRVDPLLDPLKGHPRYLKLLRRAGRAAAAQG